MKIMKPYFFLLISLATHTMSAQDTLLLFHPTAYNLELFSKLGEQDVLPLENIHILGVYQSLESYDYSQAYTWLEMDHKLSMSLLEIEPKGDTTGLFGENCWSEEFHRIFENSIGAVFMGGPDIPPAIYGEKVHLTTSVTDPNRHYLELSFLFHLLGGDQNKAQVPFLEEDKNFMILGICLGMQTMNVATGGSMIQDIPSELYNIWTADDILELDPDMMHRNYNDRLLSDCEGPTSYHFHRIKIGKKSLLGKRIQKGIDEDPLVLSSHHQALEKLGKGWSIAATSMDGQIIEAIEHEDYPMVLGVQFHPEKPGLFDPSIVHTQSCGSTINFQQAIANSDSYSFHLKFWELVGHMLKKSGK